MITLGFLAYLLSTIGSAYRDMRWRWQQLSATGMDGNYLVKNNNFLSGRVA